MQQQGVSLCVGTLRGTGVSTPGLPWSPALGPSCPVPWFLFSLTWDCREAETRSCQTGWTSRPGRDVLVCMVCMIYCFHVLNLNLSFMHFCFKVLSSPCDLKRESWYRCLSPIRGARFCISESCISLRGVPRSAVALDVAVQHSFPLPPVGLFSH